MRTRPAALALVTAAVAVSLGVTGSSSGEGSVAAAQQDVRNDVVEELGAAQGAALVPLAGELDQLTRERQRAVLAEDADGIADVDARIAAYGALTTAIQVAPTAADVHVVVARAGLPVGSEADVVSDVLAH